LGMAPHKILQKGLVYLLLHNPPSSLSLIRVGVFHGVFLAQSENASVGARSERDGRVVHSADGVFDKRQRISSFIGASGRRVSVCFARGLGFSCN
jgi:hypothetical protein